MNPLAHWTGRRTPRKTTGERRDFQWALTWLPLIGIVAFLASAQFWLVRLMEWLIKA
jgi:hypothetical protein